MNTFIKQTLLKFFVIAVTVIVPAISYCQPGPGDDNPDVPFDKDMNLVFLGIGILFAVLFIIRKIISNSNKAVPES